ncbi:hypothetical protein [Evansella halocellulosilytica]|uniref:hypothetical protein n=1 Tax=Evansella halocellulosilytica TaxID=2011013 RepID=UPI0015CE258A|nr:hypothetical protein [Evansella halocellulosilytica]
MENKDVFKQQNLIISDERLIDRETGEILNESDFDAAFTDKFDTVKRIKNFRYFKYSHRVDKKPNRQLMNDTIYSTRQTDDGDEFIIGKIKDLYDPDNSKLAKQFNKSPESFLMYEHDHRTFEKLSIIMKQYSEAKNPLAKHLEETGDYLTKYSKKDNGPVIKSVKYKSKKLGNHKDLSYKFSSKNKKVVTLSLKPYRMDVYKEGDQYKFVTVRYDDIKDAKDYYLIPERNYYEKLKAKGIDDIQSFQFSFYKGDIINIDGNEFRFIGVNNDSTNRIECNLITTSSSKRIMPTISKKIKSMKKMQTNVLGDRFASYNERLKLILNK